jgi:N-hydroxyarylamine O-acetyltransferase
MPLDRIDLSAYCTRIGYQGPHQASLAALHGIVAAHATSIPFENLDVLLGRPVRLDAESLVQKLVRERHGGYCFEHNTLLWQMLETLGFEVVGYAARVVWGRVDDTPGPRTHMLLRVTLPEGDFLADVGFGGLTLTSPLRFEIGAEQQTPHEAHRLVESDGEIELQARLDGVWTRLYHFALLPQAPIDYEVANWYTATYPTSLFTNNLLMARPEPDRRYALFNRECTIRHRDGRVERRELRDAADLCDALSCYFIVRLPEADCAAVWERLRRP